MIFKVFSTDIKEGIFSLKLFSKELTTVAVGTDVMTVKAKVATGALKAMGTAANLALGIVAGLIISLVSSGILSWIDNVVHKVDNAKESISDLISEIEELNNKFKNQQKTVKDLGKRFAELSQHVDSFGQNKDLSNEDYEEFLDISNQLAELFPSLSRVYDENGNALINMSGSVDTIVGSLQKLVEEERKLANIEIVSKIPKLYENAKTTIAEYDKSISDYQNGINKVNAFPKGYNLSDDGTLQLYGANRDELIQNIRLIEQYLGIKLYDGNLNKIAVNKTTGMAQYTNNILFGYQKELLQSNGHVLDVIFEDFNKNYNTLLNNFQSQISVQEVNKKSTFSILQSHMATWLNTESMVQTLSDDGRYMVQSIINGMDFESLFKQYDTSEQLQNAILSQLIIPLTSNDKIYTNVQKAFNDLLTIDTNHIEVMSYVTALQQALKQVESSIDISGLFTTIGNKRNQLLQSFANIVRVASPQDINRATQQAKTDYAWLITQTANFTQEQVDGWLKIYDTSLSVTENWQKYLDSLTKTPDLFKNLTPTQKDAVDKYKSYIDSISKIRQDYIDKTASGEYFDTTELLTTFQDTSFDFSNLITGNQSVDEALSDLAKLVYETVTKAFDDDANSQTFLDWLSNYGTEALKIGIDSKIDSIVKFFDNKISLLNAEKQRLENEISLQQAKGYIVSDSLYNQLISQEKNELFGNKNKLKELKDQLANVDEYDEDWYKLQSEINNTSEAIQQCDINIQNWNNDIRELDWSNFDRLQEKIQDIINSYDFLINLVKNEDLIDKDTAQYTDAGLVTIQQHFNKYSMTIDQIKEYTKEIEELQTQLNADPNDTTTQDKLRERVEQQRELVLLAEEEKQANIEIAREAIQAQIDKTQELIDKKKESLDKERSLYEYQKSISEKSKNVTDIQKQLSVYSQDNSAEGQKKVQELQKELKESQDDLKDTQYEHWKTDQENMLDNLMEEYTELQEKAMQDTNTLLSKLKSTVDTNLKDATFTKIFNDTFGESFKTSDILTQLDNKFTMEDVNKNLTITDLQTAFTTDFTTAKDYYSTVENGLEILNTTVSEISNDINGDNGSLTDLGILTNQALKYIFDKLNRNEPETYSGGGGGSSTMSFAPHYATGSKRINKDQLAWTNEGYGHNEIIARSSDGALLTRLGSGDTVFSAEMVENLWKMSQNGFKVPSVKLPTIASKSFDTNGLMIQIDSMNLPNVTNTQEFASQFVSALKNSNIQKAVQAVSIDLINGKSINNINKF